MNAPFTPPEHVTILLPPDAQGDAGRDLVARIIAALRADPTTRAALVAADQAVTTQGYVMLSELSGGPPPMGVPFYNDAIGVLSVPAPPGQAVSVVRAVVSRVAGGIEVVPETTMQTQDHRP